MAGIGVIAHDYRQMGVVTTIGHELPHEGVAYEHFLPAGPFASLPLKGNRSSLVWTETPARAAELKALSAEDAALAIEAAMGSSLGLVTVEEPLQAFPLKLQIAREFVAPRLALIGDAAHVIHPVAGQGLNLGLKDVAALAEAVIEAMRLGLDFGAADVLARYERWRRFDTALMAMVTDGMNRLFSNDVAPLRAFRDFGLGIVDRMPPVKDALIAQAAGVSSGERPAVCLRAGDSADLATPCGERDSSAVPTQLRHPPLQLRRIDLPRLVEAQHRDAVADREGELRHHRDQLGVVGRDREPRLGQRADQHFEGFDVDRVARGRRRLGHCSGDARAGAGHLDFGERDQGFGAVLERGGLEEELLFGGAIGRDHAAEVDELGGAGACRSLPSRGSRFANSA